MLNSPNMVNNLYSQSSTFAGTAFHRPGLFAMHAGHNHEISAKFRSSSVVGSGSTCTFQVVYEGSSPLKQRTLGKGDLRVLGPNGFRQSPDLASVEFRKKRTIATVTYSLVAPDGLWDANDNGTYTIKVRKKQVLDSEGNFVEADTLGSISINLPGS